MEPLTRVTVDPQVMGGKPCIRGMRVTVGTIVGLIACGKTVQDVLAEYPYLEREDVLEALSYAAWRSEEKELVMVSGELQQGALISVDPYQSRVRILPFDHETNLQTP